jgi:rsbT co-antagonist protein RsbR
LSRPARREAILSRAVTIDFVRLVDCEAGLALSPIPAWVISYDDQQLKMVWANDAALELWRAPTRAELLARDFTGGAPEKVTARLRHVVEQVRAGRILREEFAFYPQGVPIMRLVELRGIIRPDGGFGMLNQALPLTEVATESLHRAIVMSRHSAIMSALVRADGGILTQNPAALLAFDQSESWTSWFCEPAQAELLLRAALAGEPARAHLQVSARGLLRWHTVDAHALRDPVTGELGVLVEHSDETARVEAEQLAEARGQRIDSLRATLELVEQQRREILSLSAPILDVGKQTLAVPIIGRFDQTQSDELTDKLLHAVSNRSARTVILDVTGVAAVDEGSAIRLHHLLRALQLLGAAPMITGIRPELALQLVASGFDLGGLSTLRSLAEALRSTGHSIA